LWPISRMISENSAFVFLSIHLILRRFINTSTKVYHKEGNFYGKTKKGKFMTEDEAKNAGYKAAKEPVAKKAKTAKK
jgi:hypothetical protein